MRSEVKPEIGFLNADQFDRLALTGVHVKTFLNFVNFDPLFYQ
jgi:hypothetical protein